MRRPVLQATVDSSAGCTKADPDLFFRADGEPPATWQAQRAEAIRFCHGCPARAACEELALRDGDGNSRVDDLVRGGRSGSELATLRERQAQRIDAAIAADEASDTEWKKLTSLTVELSQEAGKTPSGVVGVRAQSQTAQNQRIRKLADQIRALRTARRARTGWEVAA